MDNTLKIVAGVFIAIVVACAVFFWVIPQQSVQTPSVAKDTSVEGNVTVYFFYGEECPHCHNVIPFIQNLSKKYPDVNFRILETWHNETNQALSLSLHKKLGIQSAGVPEVIVVGNNTPLVGDRAIPEQLEGVILEQIKKKQ
ncbi:MAG TPA: thioredoxin family protein [Methanoregula sp.]|nr:thioredoxin family protein [Methanoregula sp.]